VNLDKIAQAVLIIFGAIILALLVMGLLISCRTTSADLASTSTPPFASSTPFGFTPGAPIPTPIIIGQGPSPTPSVTATVGAPVAPSATTQPGATPGAPGTSGGGGYVPGTTVRHVVSRGEWLLQIARCYGVSYAALWTANPIAYPDYILPGLELTIPNIGSQGAITGAPCVVAYTVAAGDTWESLAQRYRTTVAILQRANPGALSVGRSIWVPRVP